MRKWNLKSVIFYFTFFPILRRLTQKWFLQYYSMYVILTKPYVLYSYLKYDATLHMYALDTFQICLYIYCVYLKLDSMILSDFLCQSVDNWNNTKMNTEYFLEKVDKWISTKENGKIIETLQMQKQAISTDYNGNKVARWYIRRFMSRVRMFTP